MHRPARPPFAATATAAAAAAVTAGAAIALPAAAQDALPAVRGVDTCLAEPDDRRRLACYDALFRRASVGAPARPREAPGRTPAPAATAGDDSILSRLWELDAEDKRGLFVVRTYLPNYFLPLHHSSSVNRLPDSPTRPAPARFGHRPLEAKLQVSLRAKLAQELLLPGADLWFGYTQRSLWQLWSRQDSSPFRSTDYQPELIYVVPVPPAVGLLPRGWRWRMAQFGVAHQSNGQSEPLSRSWNRLWAGAALERGQVGLSLRVHRRLPESHDDDDNPDLTRYLGRAELGATWLPGRATAALTWRTNLRASGRGSLQLDLTYPVDRDQPDGLRWYAQVFSGYGETLLDYNHRQTSVGLGLSLFQF